LIPAAGNGSRMGGARPKQYLAVAGKAMIVHTVHALVKVRGLASIHVLLAPTDRHWGRLKGPWPKQVSAIRCGGATRAATVNQALDALADNMHEDDWILVHDAARPCVDPERIETMMALLQDDPVGGLLALRVPDTVKRGNDDVVVETVSRENLWLAQTPQMFRYGVLRRALAALAPDAVTDEAQAVEALGLRPRLVPGDASNLKITFMEDLALAEAVLHARYDGKDAA
jgi:2-C-methyl-D-erythritol 4-phosphate cytidylyltransferase